MTQPNLTPVDERLRGVLLSAMQRDPNVLRNADQLQGLLADLAPDMPGDLRTACVAVARTNAVGWLTASPPYSEDQVVAWLRAQFPEMKQDVAGQAVAAFALLTGARGGPPQVPLAPTVVPPAAAPVPPAAPVQPPAGAPNPLDQPTIAPTGAPITFDKPAQPSPVFDPSAPPQMSPPVFDQPAQPQMSPPVFEQPTVAGTVGQLAGPPTSNPPAQPVSNPAGQPVSNSPTQAQPGPYGQSGPYNQPGQFGQPTAAQVPPYQATSWPPAPAPPPAKPKRKSTALIAAIVAVLLIGGGVAVWVATSGGGGGSEDKLAAPQNVTAKLESFGSVEVSWQPVDGADHYAITEVNGGLTRQDVTGTSVVFEDAAGDDHKFVVQAFTADGDAGAKSAPETWKAQIALVAPTDVTTSTSGFDVVVSWVAVDGASGYKLTDALNSSISASDITDTRFTVPNAIYERHSFVVSAVAGSATGPAADPVSFTPQHALSSAEAVLAYKLPSTFAKPGSCEADKADENQSPYITAAVSCDPANPGRTGPEVLFATQLTPGDQNKYEQAQFGHMKEKVGCDNSFPDSGTHSTWYLKGGPTLGDEYCFRTSSGRSVFAWTYYKENIAIQIEGDPPASRTGLHDWWGGVVAKLR